MVWAAEERLRRDAATATPPDDGAGISSSVGSAVGRLLASEGTATTLLERRIIVSYYKFVWSFLDPPSRLAAVFFILVVLVLVMGGPHQPANDRWRTKRRKWAYIFWEGYYCSYGHYLCMADVWNYVTQTA